MAEAPALAPTRRRGLLGWFAVGVLAVLTAVATWMGAWWAIPLLAVELLYPFLRPVWASLHGAAERLRAALQPFKRFPGALVGLPLMFAGLALGVYARGSVQWLGDGVAVAVEAIADSAPYVIFFTLTPAIAGTLATGNAGKFALYVNASYLVAALGAGLLAILIVIPVFGVRVVGAGATATAGPPADLLELLFSSAPFRGIFLAAGLSLMIHGFRLPGLFEATRFVGSKLVDLLGDLLKILLPLVLFSFGVFLPTRVARGIQRAQESGSLEGSGWIGKLSVEQAYFAAVTVLVVVLAVWVLGFAYAVMRYTRFSFWAFLRDYFFDVYAYAWATASSSASIPINLERASSGLKVRGTIRDFVIPLGATVHLDGAMVGGIVVGVVASQMVGYTPTVVDLFLLLLPLVIITVGAPGIPGGLAIVGGAVMSDLLPIPPGTAYAFTSIFVGFNIGLSDMFRTGVNSTGNGILSRLFEYWYPTKFARPHAAPTLGGGSAKRAPGS